MIYKILVWDRSRKAHHLVGEMVSDIDDRGRMRSAFRYDQGYLDASDAFSLDPVSLPLKAGTFDAGHSGFFRVFEDGLPDDWGRKLLVRKHKIPRHEQNLPNLLLTVANSGLGALSFTDKKKPRAPLVEPSLLHLADLVDAAEKFERGDALDTELNLLFAAGSSPGGARPKALVCDKPQRVHYLAKFPSVKDREDVVRLEAATMNLAAKAGLRVPATRLVECGGKSILLVRRFDILPDGGRRHMISFQTLLQAEGYYQMRYPDLLGVVRKYSSDPQGDAELLYRQMVFNGVIGNTDDHLKNFWMVHERGLGWRLSPAFDLIPDVGRRGEHVLFFDLGAYYPGRKKVEALGKSWGIRGAEEIVAQVVDAASDWKAAFATVGVPENDIRRFIDIDTRC